MSNEQQVIVPAEAEDVEDTEPKETSLLFEPISLGILMITLICAIWFRFYPLLIVTTFILILALFVMIWKWRALKHLEATLTIERSRIFVGDEFTLNASLKNDKWLPLIWIEWELPQRRFIQFTDGNKQKYMMRILWLLSYQKINWAIDGKGVERGVYDVGNMILRSGDGFRFSEKELHLQLPNVLFIYPKVQAVKAPSFETSLQWEVVGKQGGFLEDPLLINGIREYEAGDEWRRVNTRASMRTGKLQTNMYQPIVSEQVVFYLDTSTFVIDEEKFSDNLVRQQRYVEVKKERYEDVLSLICSLALTYDERDVKVGFSANALNYMNERSVSHLPGGAVTPILDELAKLTQTADSSGIRKLEQLLSQGVRPCPLFIFCERLSAVHIQFYYAMQQKYHIQFYYIYENEHAYAIGKAAKPLDDLRHEMVVKSG